jgi:hypothetical protein
MMMWSDWRAERMGRTDDDRIDPISVRRDSEGPSDRILWLRVRHEARHCNIIGSLIAYGDRRMPGEGQPTETSRTRLVLAVIGRPDAKRLDRMSPREARENGMLQTATTSSRTITARVAQDHADGGTPDERVTRADRLSDDPMESRGPRRRPGLCRRPHGAG